MQMLFETQPSQVQILGMNETNMGPAAATAQGLVLRRNGAATTLKVPPRNPTDMTIRVPQHIAAQTQQGIPPPSSGSLDLNK
jgi:hypothetical protein